VSTLKTWSYVLARPFLRLGTPQRQALGASACKKILIIRPEKLGDVFVSLPLCDALKDHIPGLKLYLLASPKSVELVREDPRFERLFLYRKQAAADIAELRRMRRERFDCIIDLVCDDSVTSLIISQLCGKRGVLIGMGKSGFRKYYDFNYPYRTGDGAHVIDNTLKVLEAFGTNCDGAERRARPFVAVETMQRATQWLSGVLREESPEPTIGINLSAGSSTRRWGNDKFVALVRRILSTHADARIVLLSVPEDHESAERLCSEIGARSVIAAPRMNLQQVSALISQFSILVTPDTALVHIARSFSVPVVGLYSRFMENYKLWRPYGQSGGVVVSRNDNIFDISIEEVSAAFEQVLLQGRAAVR
jgi:ADP-heptose:LPS heptosyltransferase